jgi:hypothetical protein
VIVVLTICKAANLKTLTMASMDDIENDLHLQSRRGKQGAQKFTKGTKAYKHLEKLFKDKAILPTDKPADVRSKDPLFQDFTNQQFRSQFNKLKGIFGTSTKEGKSPSSTSSGWLLYYCYSVLHTAFLKRMQDDEDGNVVGDRNKAPGDDKMFAKLNDHDEEEDPLAWVPKKIVSEWTNDDGIRCISIIFQLSGGATISDSNDAEVQVSSTGDELAVSEVWNPLMADVRNWYLTFPKHKNESDENAMRKHIAMADTCDKMASAKQKRSTYRMILPFRVDPSVKRIRFLGTEDGQRYAAVDLAERSMSEVEEFKLFTSKVRLPNSDKKRKHSTLF